MRKFVKDLWQVYLPDRATKSKHLLARDDFCLLLASGQALSYNTEKAHACKTSSPSFVIASIKSLTCACGWSKPNINFSRKL